MPDMSQSADSPGSRALNISVDLFLTPSARQELERGTAGHTLLFSQSPATSMLAKAASDPNLTQADIAFGQPDPAAAAAAPRLKWIQISSSGITRYDNADFRARMANRKIMVCNSARVFAESCATHVFSFMLGQARQLPIALRTRLPHGAPDWHQLRGSCVPLAGQSAVILGYGAIGARLAEMLAPFRMRITAYRRHPRGDETVPVIGESGLPDALAAADHVINILPDSAQTRNFFGAARLAQIKRGAVFYNIGRGNTVDQLALAAALESGRLSAAWLDVTEPEPLPEGHPLLAQPHCYITPHTAGGHADEVGDLVRHFLSNLARFEKGEPLLDRVM